MLDEDKFLSDYGLRSLSKEHERQPFKFDVDDMDFSIGYQPGESQSFMFGGNSNWRGPIWFPLNYLMIEALLKYNNYYGDSCSIEMPSKSGVLFNLEEVAVKLSQRLINVFLQDEKGGRPYTGDSNLSMEDPQGQENILFYEYFHGDTGAGLGASHQTGWTALVAKLIQDCA